jgi:transposase
MRIKMPRAIRISNCHRARKHLEVGPLSQWLYSVLAEAGLPVICDEMRHMRGVLKAQINKT